MVHLLTLEHPMLILQLLSKTCALTQETTPQLEPQTALSAKSGAESGLSFLNGGPRTMKIVITLTCKWPT